MTTYSMLDVALGRARGVLVTRYVRARGCRRLSKYHAWGRGGWLSFILAWRTNPSGKQGCGCIYEYGVPQ